MAEKFEIFDELGSRIGIAPRTVVHQKGYWHRASNVFLFRPDGRLLIQRRQTTKDVWPGAWDVSAAEHLMPAETFEQGAHRGLREELGVVGAALEVFGAVTKSRLEVPESDIRDFEFQQSFRTVYGGEVSPDQTEVAEVRSVEPEELAAEFARQPENFTPWFRRRAIDLALFSVWRRLFSHAATV